jgi:hypothetical protein
MSEPTTPKQMIELTDNERRDAVRAMDEREFYTHEVLLDLAIEAINAHRSARSEQPVLKTVQALVNTFAQRSCAARLTGSDAAAIWAEAAADLAEALTVGLTSSREYRGRTPLTDHAALCEMSVASSGR